MPAGILYPRLPGTMLSRVADSAMDNPHARPPGERKKEMAVKRTLAALLVLLAIGLWVLMGYLIYVLPKQVAMWSAEEEALPAATVVLIDCGQVCQTFGLVILPLLVLLTLGATFWLRLTCRRAPGKPTSP
jgi:type II secretory pathway component PulF